MAVTSGPRELTASLPGWSGIATEESLRVFACCRNYSAAIVKLIECMQLHVW